MESINLHHNLLGLYDEKISKNEFLEFFTYFSASVADDKFFEKIIVAVFRILNETNLHQNYAGSKNVFDQDHKSSYLQDHHRYMIHGGSVSSNAPFGTFSEGTDYNNPL